MQCYVFIHHTFLDNYLYSDFHDIISYEPYEIYYQELSLLQLLSLLYNAVVGELLEKMTWLVLKITPELQSLR